MTDATDRDGDASSSGPWKYLSDSGAGATSPPGRAVWCMCGLARSTIVWTVAALLVLAGAADEATEAEVAAEDDPATKIATTPQSDPATEIVTTPDVALLSIDELVSRVRDQPWSADLRARVMRALATEGPQRRACVDALIDRGDATARRLVVEALVTVEDPDFRAHCLDVLPAFGDAAADHLSLIRSFAGSPDAAVRSAAAAALFELRDHGAIRLWINLLADSDHEVVRQAHRALATITDQRFGAAPAGWRSWFDPLHRRFQARLAAIRQGLAAKSADARLAAVRELLDTRYHDHLVVELLAPLLIDHDRRVAEEVRQGLARVDGALALRTLLNGEYPDGAGRLVTSQPAPVASDAAVATEAGSAAEGPSDLSVPLIAVAVVVLASVGMVLIFLSRRHPEAASETEKLLAKIPGRDPNRKEQGERTRRIMRNMRRMTFS